MKKRELIPLLPNLLLIFSLLCCSSPPDGYTVLCAGDSITEQGYPRFLQRMFSREGIKAKVLNYGKSGYTSGEYLRFLTENEVILANERPDFILLQLGTNDVRQDHDSTPAIRFYDNMKEIIRRLKHFQSRSGKTAEILLATIPPIPEGSPFPFTPESHKRVLDEINPLITRICGEEGVILVDNYALFFDSPHLLPEVHPSKEGYKALAQNWFVALKAITDR